MSLRAQAEALDFEYNPEGDGEYPAYTRSDWRSAVNQQSTLLGYWDWVAQMLDEEAL
jgi:hypothetical protein